MDIWVKTFERRELYRVTNHLVDSLQQQSTTYYTYPICDARGIGRQPRAQGASLVLGSVEPADLLPEHRLEGHPPHAQREPLRRHGERQNLREESV